MSLVALLLPALLGAGLAIMLRARLARLSLLTWLGWTLVGAGLPVLAGQLAALVLASGIEARAAACEAAGGDCSAVGTGVALALAAGLAGGLGWFAGALSARLTAR